jgi:hypothetical protein
MASVKPICFRHGGATAGLIFSPSNSTEKEALSFSGSLHRGGLEILNFLNQARRGLEAISIAGESDGLARVETITSIFLSHIL